MNLKQNSKSIEIDMKDDKIVKYLFDIYYQRLCLFSVQITNSLEQSEDIVQEIFIYLWEKKKQFPSESDLKAYLYYSVKNASIAFNTKNKRFSIEEIDNLLSYHPIDEKYDKQELLQKQKQILERLKKLSPEEHKVLSSIVFENKKYKEVAKDLGISVNTVKTYLARAYKKIRSHTSFFSFLFPF